MTNLENPQYVVIDDPWNVQVMLLKKVVTYISKKSLKKYFRNPSFGSWKSFTKYPLNNKINKYRKNHDYDSGWEFQDILWIISIRGSNDPWKNIL